MKSELKILLACFGLLTAMALLISGIVYIIGLYFFWPEETMQLVTYTLMIIGIMLVAKYV